MTFVRFQRYEALVVSLLAHHLPLDHTATEINTLNDESNKNMPAKKGPVFSDNLVDFEACSDESWFFFAFLTIDLSLACVCVARSAVCQCLLL